jgi:hypothetical protein
MLCESRSRAREFVKSSAAVISTAFLACAFLASPANSVAVTDWNFTLEAGFIAFAPAAVTGSDNNAFLSAENGAIATTTGLVDFAMIGNVPTALSWGMPLTSAGQSSFVIGGASGHVSGSVVTDGTVVNTITLTHNNNRIMGTPLTSASLFHILYLDPELPITPAETGPSDRFALAALHLQIDFLETPNHDTCPVLSPTLCNDIFVIDVTTSGFNPADNSLNQNFTYAGENYSAKLFVSELSVLSDAACGAAGADPGCIGFTTVEGQSNVFQASLQITSMPFNVPEPGTLAAFGFGLAGLAFQRRRRQSR